VGHESSDRKPTMHNPYAAPASLVVGPSSDEARASVLAGALVAALALVRSISCLVIVYVGATDSGEVLADLPRGIRVTVVSEMMAFPFLGLPLALVYGALAIPLLRATRRFRGPTLAIQTLYTLFPLLGLRRTFVRAQASSLVFLAVANLLLALLPMGILVLLLSGRSTPGRFRQASVGIALLCLLWATRLIGIF